MHPDDRNAADGGPPALPTSPTGRVPQWVLDEAAGFPVSPIPWRPAVLEPPRRRRRGPRGLLAAVVVFVLALGAAGLLDRTPRVLERPAPSVDAGAPPSTGPLADRPTPSADAARSPLGVPAPAPAPADRGPYLFARFQADGVTPVAYDPCRPVHYVTRATSNPPGGDAIVRSALARVSEVTGLRFVDDGPSDEATTRDRAHFQPDRYGDRWAPVLIAWETEEENPDLAGDRVGEGGSVAVSLGDGPKVYVTGTVSLDATQLPELLDQRDGERAVAGVVLHELGHLVGLDHVDDDGQLMYPEARRGVSDYADGDVTGLVQLGAGVCVPEL